MMKAIITSDWHLSKDQFAATEGGRNRRQMDIEAAAARAVDVIVDVQPDLVLIGGDTFDSVRPSMHAIRCWQQCVRRIIRETPAEVVVVLGNHEAGRSTQTLSPVVVVQGEPRVHLATEPKRIRIRLRDGTLASIACFPFLALAREETYALEPDPEAEYNVLLMHAAVKSSAEPGSLPYFYQGPTSIDVSREADRFDVIALGDYHTYTELVPGRCVVYPGSIERTSSDIWHEPEPKGLVVYEDGAHRFVEIETRPVLDVEPRDCTPDYLDPMQLYGFAEVNAAVQGLLDASTTKDAIVRLVAENFPRQDRDRIDWSLVRELKHRALHFELVLRYGAVTDIDIVDRRLHATPLIDQARQFLAGYPADVQACCISYLEAREAA
jgi:hypothetical protein